MKRNLFALTFLFLTMFGHAQEVFTNVFLPLTPFSLHTIEDDLYVGIFGQDATRPAGIYKVAFSDSDNEILVSQIDFGGVGVLELAHDQSTNILYASNITGIYKVDLNQSLPVTPELLYDGAYEFINGLLLKDGFLYASNSEEILKINVLNSSAEIIYTVPDDRSIIMGEIVNNLLYYFERLNTTKELDLVSFNLNDSDPSGTLISDMNGYAGFIQDAYAKNNTLYATIESAGPAIHHILKFDLNNSIPLLADEVLTFDSSRSALGVTSYQTDLYYCTGDNDISRLEDSSLSIPSIKELHASVWPNPVKKQLTVNNSAPYNSTFVIHTATGSAIRKGALAGGVIDCSDLKSGLYFLTLKTETQTQVLKFIKL